MKELQRDGLVEIEMMSRHHHTHSATADHLTNPEISVDDLARLHGWGEGERVHRDGKTCDIHTTAAGHQVLADAILKAAGRE